MSNQEKITNRNIRFLTIEEEKTLKSQTTFFGKQSAEAGIPTIINNLEKLVDLAKKDRTATHVPAEFLTSASVHLWETGTDPNTIFALYKKWFAIDIDNSESLAKSDTMNEIQTSFANLAGKFTTAEKDPLKQKQTLAKSVDFIDKNSGNQQDKVALLIYYAKYLFEHGMKKEGRKIAETTASLAPKTIERLLDLKAILQQVCEK